MGLTLYYMTRTVKNQIRKLCRTWVAVFLLVCLLAGVIFGVGAAALASLEAVRSAIAALDAGYPIDLCCTDAEDAMSSLRELDGRAVSEDIVSQIFSHFCVGK